MIQTFTTRSINPAGPAAIAGRIGPVRQTAMLSRSDYRRIVAEMLG